MESTDIETPEVEVFQAPVELMLTPRQELFAELWYACGGNATEAMRQLEGLPPDAKVATNNYTKNPSVRRYYEQRVQGLRDSHNFDKATASVYLHRILRRCMQAEQIIDRDGNNIGLCRFDAKGALDAVKQLMVLHGVTSDVGSKNNPMHIISSTPVRFSEHQQLIKQKLEQFKQINAVDEE